MKRVGIIIIITASTIIACGGGTTPESFEPSERATARTPEGYTAAEYELATPQGDIADVKVWSHGARTMAVKGIERTVVHVGFELENLSEKPIELADVTLDSATLDRQVVSGIEPALADGATTVEPGRVSQISVYFPLPVSVSPQEVDAFRVRWRIRGPNVSYVQYTPFVESPDDALVYYHTPYYDPFYYDWYLHHPRVIVHRYPYRHYHRYR